MYGVGRSGPGRARYANADRGRSFIKLVRETHGSRRPVDRHGVRRGAEVCARSSPLFLVLQLGQVDRARVVASGHCGCFRCINRTGILHLFDNALTVELPNIFTAASTYTNRETAVGVHIDHYAFARPKAPCRLLKAVAGS